MHVDAYLRGEFDDITLLGLLKVQEALSLLPNYANPGRTKLVQGHENRIKDFTVGKFTVSYTTMLGKLPP